MFLLDLTVCLMLTVYFYTGPPYDGTNKERVVLPVASLFRHRFSSRAAGGGRVTGVTVVTGGATAAAKERPAATGAGRAAPGRRLCSISFASFAAARARRLSISRAAAALKAGQPRHDAKWLRFLSAGQFGQQASSRRIWQLPVACAVDAHLPQIGVALGQSMVA